jgi:transcriptional regulator with PAS, ATPase and Fis domain
MVGVVSIFRDITDIIKVNQKLEFYRNYAKKLTKQRLVFKEELPTSFKSITGNNPFFVQVLQLASKVAPTEAPVLLEGESGVGKELIAVAIHSASLRSGKPFVAVNCAAIPESLFESEMFGYEEGAFTGAKKMGKKGKFDLANGGTLFLDEIGDLPLNMQAKLLRVLQEGQVERLGATRLEPVNVRIIAATNNNIDDLMEQNKFRQDLYFRLNVINIKIPPLRERLDDIRLLADEFLNSSNRPALKLSIDVINAFHKYPWPGNVRELENVVRHAVIVCQENEVALQDLPDYFHEQMLKSADPVDEEDETCKGEGGNRLEKYVAEAEKRALREVIEKCGNNRTRAMRLLGLSRGTFYNKLKKYGLI